MNSADLISWINSHDFGGKAPIVREDRGETLVIAIPYSEGNHAQLFEELEEIPATIAAAREALGY